MTHLDLTQYLHHALEALPPGGGIVVAFSGGMDSTVLLHALAHLPAARARGLRALHVDHGLHPDSASWARHCAYRAQGLGIAIDTIRVEVERNGTGLEDAARKQRLDALAQQLAPGEILALAQHRDDQAETILLKLLRGAGPEGLAGMRTMRQFAQGYLWRPLLGLPRAALHAHARSHELRWVEDPSNRDTQLRRNFLRAEILPRLLERWPDAHAALAHSATWARHAAEFIDAQGTQALASMQGLDPATLDWSRWLALPDALRDPVLRQWLRQLGLDEPAHFHVAELERQLRGSARDRNPCVRWDNTEVRRYRDLLYAMRPAPPVPADWNADWNGGLLALPDGGSLALERGADLRIAGPAWHVPAFHVPAFHVRYRRGGERLRPAGKPHSRELRLLLQEAGVPPWQRARVPLIFAGEQLLAAGDLFLSEPAQVLCAQLDARIVWRN